MNLFFVTFLQIYSMTLRLSNLFEDQLKTISRSINLNKERYRKKPTATQADRNGRLLKMTTRATATASTSQRNHHPNESDDDDDDDAPIQPKPERISARRNRVHATNGVSSSSIYAADTVSGPSTSSAALSRRPTSRSHSQELNVETDSTTSSSDSSDSDDTDSNDIPISALSVNSKQRKKVIRNFDSEDSYKPNSRRKVMKKTDKKTMKKAKRLKQIKRKEIFKTNSRSAGRPAKPRAAYTDNDEDYNVNSRSAATSPNKRTPARSSKTNVRPQTGSSNNSEEDPKEKKTRRAQRTSIVDHSYHLPTTSSTRRMQLESESENEIARPTRSTIRRQQMAWMNDEDSIDNQQDEVIPKPTTSQV